MASLSWINDLNKHKLTDEEYSFCKQLGEGKYIYRLIDGKLWADGKRVPEELKFSFIKSSCGYQVKDLLMFRKEDDLWCYKGRN